VGTQDRIPALMGAAVLSIGIALAGALPAAADPPPGDPPPTPPSPIGLIPPRATLGDALAQSGSEPVGPLGLPDLSAHTSELLLGQNAAPAAPGHTGPLRAPDLNAFNDQYLPLQNAAPAAPGQGSAVGPAPVDDGATTRFGYLRRLLAMYQAGNLTGALLGQMPEDQLGQPLPGTAPAPGIFLPPGLGHNLPDPAVATPPADG